MPENTAYLGGYRDTFGIPRTFPLPTIQRSTSEEEIQAAAREVEELVKPEQVKDQQAANLWNTLNLRVHRPTQWQWRNTTFLGKVVAFLEKILHFFAALWPWRPKLVDQKLMAAIMGDRIVQKLGHLGQAPLSEAFDFVVRFLEQEKKDAAPPKELLKQFRQCADWSRQIEAVAKLTDHKKRNKGIETLSVEVSKTIEKLKKGESCLIPGGWNQQFIANSALYQVTKTDETHFQLKVISRDPQYEANAKLTSAGKVKVYPEMTFGSLAKEEVSDRFWLQGLLSLQLMETGNMQEMFTGVVNAGFKALTSSDKKDDRVEKAGLSVVLPVDQTSVMGLLKRFADRQIPPTGEMLARFKTQASSCSHAKTVWMLVDLAANPDAKKTGTVECRKLRYKMTALFEFFAVTVPTLADNRTNRILLKEGLKSVTRSAVLLHQKGLISDADMKKMNEETAVIEEAIQAAETREGKVKKGSPFKNMEAGKSYTFEAAKMKLKAVDAKEVGTGEIENARTTVSPFPDALADQAVVPQDVDQAWVPTSATVKRDLARIRGECEQLAEQKNDGLLQEKIMTTLRVLEMPTTERYHTHGGKSKKRIADTDFWKGMSVEDLVACSRELSTLSRLLTGSIKQTNQIFPDRLLLLAKASMLQDHLFRLNKENSKGDDYFHFELFDEVRDFADVKGTRFAMRSLYEHVEANEELRDSLRDYHYYIDQKHNDYMRSKKMEVSEFERSRYRDVPRDQTYQVEERYDTSTGMLTTTTRYSARNTETRRETVGINEDRPALVTKEMVRFRPNGKQIVARNALEKKFKQKQGTKDGQDLEDDQKLEAFWDGKTPPAQVQDMIQQHAFIRSVVPQDKTKNVYSLRIGGEEEAAYKEDVAQYKRRVKRIKDSWNKRYESKYFLGAATRGEIQGSSWRDRCLHTQEAIVDKPEKAAKEWAPRSERRRFYLINVDQEENVQEDTFHDISREDLRDIFLSVQEGNYSKLKMAAWQLMGLVKTKRYLLKEPDVRNFIEHVMMSCIQQNFENNETALPEALAEWIQEQIEVVGIQEQVLPVLFLMDLSNKLRTQVIKAFGEDDDRVSDFPDYSGTIREWAKASLDPSKPQFPHRNTLWTHVLLSYENAPHLTAKDAKRMMKAIAAIRMSPPEPSEYDPLVKNAVARTIGRWQQPLQAMMARSEPLRQNVLDSICRLSRSPLPREAWNGTFPEYQAGPYRLNVMAGTVLNMVDGSSKAGLPIEMVVADEVENAFPNDDINAMMVNVFSDETTKTYAVKDAAGMQSQIVDDADGVRVYKCIEVDDKKVWAQHVLVKNIFPADKPKSDFSFKGLWATIRTFMGLISQSKKPQPPKFLFNPDYRYWVDPKQPKAPYILGKDGKLLFQISFKKKWGGEMVLDGIRDFRSGKSGEKQHVSSLDRVKHPLWKKVCRFEDPGKILVWRKKGKVECVELLRYGFSFIEKDGKAVCTDPRLKGWILDDSNAWSPVDRGIPHGLVLRHPTIPNKRRVLVPNQKITPKERDAKPSLWLMVKVVISLFRGIIPIHLFEDADPASSVVGFVRTAPEQTFFTFDIDPNTKELLPPDENPANAYLYLAQVSMVMGDSDESLGFLLQAEKNIGKGFEAAQQLEKALGGFPNTPDSNVLKLHALRLLAKKGPASKKEEYEKLTAEAYIKYLGYGGSVPVTLRLDGPYEVECLNLLKRYNNDFYKRNAPLLATVETDEKRAMKANISTLKFSEKRSGPVHKISACIKNLMSDWLTESKDYSDQFFNRAITNVGLNYLDLYKIARDGDVKGKEFRQLDMTLQSMSEHVPSEPSSGNEDLSIPRGEYLSTLLHYLRTITDARHGGNATDLPPEVIAFDRAAAEEYEKQRWRTWGEERDRLEDPNLETVQSFLTRLEAWAENHQEEAEEIEPLVPDVDEVTLRKVEEDLRDAVRRMEDENPSVSYEQMTIEDLERACLSQETTEVVDLQLAEQATQALYTGDQLESYFIENPDKFSPEDLDLSDLESHASSVVRKGAEDLKEELEAAKEREGTPLILKDEEARLALQQLMLERKAEAEEIEEELEEAAMKLIYPKITSVDLVTQRAKMAKTILREDVIKHYLQRSLHKLKEHLPEGTEVSELRSKMGDYLIAATERQRIDAALEAITQMDPNEEGITAIACENLHVLLTAKRQYDPSLVENQHLLIFEFLSSILMRGNQLKMVQDFLHDPDCVRQAITGAGKTSVILVLTALMKAKGDNLVSVVFPKPLYEDNLDYLQRKLGRIFQRNVYPLRFNMQKPLRVDVTENGETKKISAFKVMYEDIIRTMLSKGVVATTLESLQALEQKWIHLADLIGTIPEEDAIPQMELEHFNYLTKILGAMRLKQELVLDEFDKALNPREERHLKVGESRPVADFVWEASLEVYDELLAQEEVLGIRRNIQAELTDAERAQILEQTARRMGEQWDRVNDTDAFVAYVRGRDEALLDQIDEWTDAEKDRLALLKNQFSIFLPLTLSKTAEVNYIRSADGVTTVPCLASDTPREGAENEEILERVNYTIQDYYQTGMKEGAFKKWLKELKQEAEEEIEDGNCNSIEDTVSGQLFRNYFPEYSLMDVLDSEVPRFVNKVNNDPALLRKFLRIELAKLEVSSKKVTCDGHDLVSGSAHALGASATLSCLLGVHHRMHTEGAEDKGTTGEMVRMVLEKSRPQGGKSDAMLHYDPEHPEKLIEEAFKHDADFQSVVDGAAALHGISMPEIAQQLLSEKAKGIVHFDKSGKKQVLTENETVPLERVDLRPAELGMALSEKESRGADVRLGQNNRILVTANPRQGTTKILQTAGRSRGRGQRIRYIASTRSGLQNPAQYIKNGVVVDAEEGGDNLFRAEKHRLRNIVRNEMMQELQKSFILAGVTEFREKYAAYSEAKILVSEKEVNFDTEGSYFAKYGTIEQMDKEPRDVLTGLQEKYLRMATDLGLDEAVAQLRTVQYSDELIERMPEFVFSAEGPQTDQEVEVETETQTEVQTELELEAEEDQPEDLAYYLKWLNSFDDNYRVHDMNRVNAAYHHALQFTENFLPLHRREWADRRFWRTAHDSRQNPLYHVLFKINTRTPGGDAWDPVEAEVERTVTEGRVIDVLEADRQIHRTSHEQGWSFINRPASDEYLYDMRLRRVISSGQQPSEEDLAALEPYIAQLRFFDGQYRRYSEGEFAVLKEWIRENDVDAMENYFYTDVLRNRPKDRERYEFSPLRRLFNELRQEREAAPVVA